MTSLSVASARLPSLLDLRYRISTQLYIGIGGAVLLTVAASLVGWFSFNSVGASQSHVNEESIPNVVAAFGVAQHSATLVAAAPRLAAATTPQDLVRVEASIDSAYASLEEQLALLGVGSEGQRSLLGGSSAVDIDSQELHTREMQGADSTDRFERIRANVDTLILNIDTIEVEMADLFDLDRRREALRAELTDLRIRLDNILIPAVDDQFFYTMTGYSRLGDPPVDRGSHFSDGELAHYRYLEGLRADSITAIQLLESAFSVSDAPLIEPLRERFESAKGSIERSLSALQEYPIHDEVEPIITRLFELGTGDDNGFDLIDRDLHIVDSQQRHLTENRDISVVVLSEVDDLVSAARSGADDATQASTQAVFTGRVLLLAISAVSISGALLIAWGFVGRILLRRLQMLSDWMRRMASGDLDTTVEIGGRDEVADMAAALEVFRQNSREALRVDEAERLAKELQEKNGQLEVVLEDLEKAQDQIVMREKLAALGELTAGVAHEIKNPLNFVKNFSEVSEELLVEFKEVMEEIEDKLDEEQSGLLQEISEDLSSNLERIRSHGDRANRIVHDMLMMGRGSGDAQPTDINGLLDEYTALAYHSARATDPDFNLTIERELGDEVGQLEIIPQDMGRVFLNMVGNACYATDDKRRNMTDTTETYFPTLMIKTERDDEHVTIRIRDNGNGMPPEVVEKIFNPFFTTKPTGEGTGLGLAMSSDIVREHGGTIRVETEPGEFTEMIVELPLEPPQTLSEESEEEAEV